MRVVYVTADGSPTERELAPLDLAAGAVRAVDRASAQVITIPLARDLVGHSGAIGTVDCAECGPRPSDE